MTMGSYIKYVDMYESTKENYEITKLLSETKLLEMYCDSIAYSESVRQYNENAADDEKIDLIYTEEAAAESTTDDKKDKRKSDFEKAKKILADKTAAAKTKIDAAKKRMFKTIIGLWEKIIKLFSGKYVPGVKKVYAHLSQFKSFSDIDPESLKELKALDPGTPITESVFIKESFEDEEVMTEAKVDNVSVTTLLRTIFNKVWSKKKVSRECADEYIAAMSALADGKENLVAIKLNLKSGYGKNILHANESSGYTLDDMQKILKKLKEQESMTDKLSANVKLPEHYEIFKENQRLLAEDIKTVNEKFVMLNKLQIALLAIKSNAVSTEVKK